MRQFMCAHSNTAKGTAFANRVKRDHCIAGSRNATARNETGELRHRSRKGHSSLSCVGHETTKLAAGIHDGLGLRCLLRTRRTDVGLPKTAVECSSWKPNLQNRRRQTEARLNPIRCHKQRSNEQRRQECRLDLESLTLRRETRWTEMNRRCASDSHGPGDTSSSGEKVAQNFRDTRPIADGVSRARARGGSNVVTIFSQCV